MLFITTAVVGLGGDAVVIVATSAVTADVVDLVLLSKLLLPAMIGIDVRDHVDSGCYQNNVSSSTCSYSSINITNNWLSALLLSLLLLLLLLSSSFNIIIIIITFVFVVLLLLVTVLVAVATIDALIHIL